MNILELFVNSCSSSELNETPGMLYKKYKNWCRENNYSCLKKDVFFLELYKIWRKNKK
jgi:hypothetical protein